MAITEEKTVTVADATRRGERIHVEVSRGLTAAESRELRKLLKKAERELACERPHQASIFAAFTQGRGI